MRQGAAAVVQAATSKGTAQETARCQIWIRVGSRAKASLGSWIRSVGDDEMNERVLLSLVAIHWDGESERVDLSCFLRICVVVLMEQQDQRL